MHIKSIKIEGFRNIEREFIEFDPKFNLIYGSNAAGKTSIVESIYFCAFGKSFRGKDLDLINHGRDFCRVEAVFSKHQQIQRVEYAISKYKGKWIKINAKNAKNLADVMTNIQIVVFSPDDLRIMKDGPAVRRLFLNKEISNISKLYYSNFVEYNRILKQRNAILKRGDSGLDLEIWDEKFSEMAAKLILKRLWFVKVLNDISRQIHEEISDGKEILELQYKSDVLSPLKNTPDERSTKESMIQILRKNIEIDRRRGFTGAGPHADDIEVSINQKNAKIYGSQGQQRTAALSIKLAEVDLIKRETGESPIVLLDDIFSELDVKRQHKIQQVFEKSQVIVTNAEDFGKGNKIEVQNGTVIKRVFEETMKAGV